MTDGTENVGTRAGSEATDLEGEGIWRQFTIADGLPDMKIECIFGDSRGDLWVGTHDRGVVRYDGTRFEGFSRPDGLPGDGVYSVLEDSDGNLWFGTSGGLGRYDGEAVEHVDCGGAASFLWGNCRGDDGALWFGLERTAGEPAAVVRVRDGEACRLVGGTADDSVGHSIHQIVAHDGQIVCAGHGLYVVEGEGLRCVDASLCGRHQVKLALSRADGTLWLCSSTRLFSYVLGVAGSTKGIYDGDLVEGIAEDSRGRAWIATHSGRLLCCEEGRIYPESSVDAVLWRTPYIDGKGAVWLGSYGMGLFSYDEERLQVYTDRHGLPARGTNCAATDADGAVWVGTHNGLARSGTGRFEPVVTEDAEEDTAVTALLADATGKVWAGTRDGHVAGYHSNGEALHVSALPERHTVNQLAEAPDGSIWFSSRYGRTLGYLHDGSLTEIGLDRQSLCPTSIGAMAIDSRGGLWLGSAGSDGSDGLYTYDGTSFCPIDLDLGCPVLALLCDSRDRLWVGTPRGLVCRDGARVTWLSQSDGLPCDIVTSIAEDDDGVIWFGTEGGGVGGYDGHVFQVIEIPGSVSLNVVRDLHIGVDGAIWISTQGGLVRFQRMDRPPSVRLVEVRGDGVLGDPLQVEVPVSCPNIVFRVEGSSPIEDSSDLVYQYRLQDHDGAWQQTCSREIVYHMPGQGQYRFLVRAVDRDLRYSELAQADVTVTADPMSAALNEALKSSTLTGEFIGSSAALTSVRNAISQVAPSGMTVLVLGETGTGKGLVARAIHELSPRSAGPLIHVNCGSIQESLIDSELFGHERGAFTGAVARKMGRLELAQGGTIFLDEIGDLPPPSQARLLHVLHEAVISRVGGTEEIVLDVRVVAATNRDLKQCVADRTFREDLYYRLCAYVIEMPPLRDRLEDIPALAVHFAALFSEHLSKYPLDISQEAIRKLKGYHWPGNVRELEHMVQRAVVLADGGEITPDLIGVGGSVPLQTGEDVEIVSLEEHERRYLTRVLSHTDGVIQGENGAAALLGLHPSTLRSRLIKLGIRPRGPGRGP